MKAQLGQIAHARSSAIGDSANISVIARSGFHYPTLAREVTAARVKEFFGGLVKGPVERYELPNLGALNFVLRQALGGGAAVSLRLDAEGRALSAALLRLEIEIDEHELAG